MRGAVSMPVGGENVIKQPSQECRIFASQLAQSTDWGLVTSHVRTYVLLCTTSDFTFFPYTICFEFNHSIRFKPSQKSCYGWTSWLTGWLAGWLACSDCRCCLTYYVRTCTRYIESAGKSELYPRPLELYRRYTYRSTAKQLTSFKGRSPPARQAVRELSLAQLS